MDATNPHFIYPEMNMSQLSNEQRAWSRNMQAHILQSLAAHGQSVAAEQMGVDSSTITRLKDSHLENLCNLMAVISLKVVRKDMKCYNPAKVEVLYALARDNLMKSEQVDDFFHDDARLQIEQGIYQPCGSLEFKSK